MSAPQPYPPQSAAARTAAFVARVLWTAIPVGTLGFFAWVPALHIARKRHTRAAWWWMAGLTAATVAECVSLAVIPSKGQGPEGAAAGGFIVTYLVTATVYAWRGCGPDRPDHPGHLMAAPNPYAASVTEWTPFPAQGMPLAQGMPQAQAMPMPMAMAMPEPMPRPTPTPSLTAPSTPTHTVPPAPPAPPAAGNDLAAEIQADLRELRGFLGGGEAR